MKSTPVRLVALAVSAVALAAAPPVRAMLDPATAQAALDHARETSHYTFCDHPRLPLSIRARALCGHAASVSACAGFVDACNAPETSLARCNDRRSRDREAPSDDRWKRWAPILGEIARWLVWGLMGAMIAALIAHFVVSRRRAVRDRGLADEVTDDDATAKAATDPEESIPLDEEGLLRRAEAHTLAGEYPLALQLYLGAALRALGRSGAVRLGRDRTNGEYVRSCSDAEAKTMLREIVREVERVQFGREAPTQDRVAATARRAVAIVRSSAVAALVVAALGALGCGADPCSKVEVPGDDPAGLELFRDVLEAQGVRVARLGRSLASLGEPAWWRASASAVVVDTETIEIDDETRAHLATWVEAGGILILAGAAPEWAQDLGIGAKTNGEAGTLHVLPPTSAGGSSDDDAPEPVVSGTVVREGALDLPVTATAVAWVSEAAPYAGLVSRGSGSVLSLATDELLTNAGLARPGNAAAMTTILSRLDRTEILVAEPDDGVAPPSSPFTSLMRAGLGLGLVHALVAAAIVFLAAGVRLARPRASSPPSRRSFAEHVRAVGGLYHRSSNAAHALAAYAGFAEERLRARMPRGTTDVAVFLAQRTGSGSEECERLWARAVGARAGGPARGDELVILKELSALCTSAIAPRSARPVESEGS